MLKATPSNSTTAPGAHPGANVDWTLHDRYKAAVEHLEALALEIARQLDELSGDPDLEDGGDDEPGGDEEPSLGSLGSGARRQAQERWAGHEDDDGRDSDLEEQCEDEGADIGDLEPWLGRVETGLGACQFSLGCYSDVLDGEVFLSPVEVL